MIRVAEQRDFKYLVLMGLEFIEASGYNFPVHKETLFKFIQSFLDDPDKIAFVIDDGGPVGMLAAMLVTPYYSNVQVAQEIVWWVDPAYRGKRDSLKLLDAYEAWAKAVGATSTHLSCIEDLNGSSVASLYLRKGYHKAESTFVKEL